MNETIAWETITHYAGFDWAKDHHDVVVVAQQGKIVQTLTFEHAAEGWAKWKELVTACPHLAVAIETSQGAAIEQLLDSGVAVYPVNPKSAERYRDRKAPSGTKTDLLDAWSLADALRVDGHGWRALKPLDPLIQELRLVCRDEVELIGKKTEMVNQLQATLHEYYPAALQAFADWTASPSWSFVQQFPTPELLHQAGRRKWEKFLHAQHLYRPGLNEKRLDETDLRSTFGLKASGRQRAVLRNRAEQRTYTGTYPESPETGSRTHARRVLPAPLCRAHLARATKVILPRC